MSDGGTDMIRHFEGLLEDFISATLEYYIKYNSAYQTYYLEKFKAFREEKIQTLFHTKQDHENFHRDLAAIDCAEPWEKFSGEQLQDARAIIELGNKLEAVPPVFYKNNWYLPQDLYLRFYDKNQAAHWWQLPELMRVLHSRGKFSELIRLQQETYYNDKILVFVDNDGRISHNGVHYQRDWNRLNPDTMEFCNGYQDLILYLAKCGQHNEDGLGDRLKFDRSFMIAARLTGGGLGMRFEICEVFQSVDTWHRDGRLYLSRKSTPRNIMAVTSDSH